MRSTREAEPLLAIRDLSVSFATPDGDITAVSSLDLELGAGECLGVVGESGAGKSQALLAVMGLLAPNARVAGSARLAGEELLGRPASELSRIRGARVSMIFQDPMTSLTPHLRIGDQIAESLVRHRRSSWREGRRRAVEILKRVHVNEPERRARQYPHELSGGMRQRAMIAIALACEPELLIADEPTTALDVTIQAQILQLLAELKRDQGMSLVLITHDLGVVAGLADRVAVLYGGRLIESGTTREILKAPSHPYTQALLRSMPRIDEPAERPLLAIAGQPPNPRELPAGCAFHPRCELALERCRAERPRLALDGARRVACHLRAAARAPTLESAT